MAEKRMFSQRVICTDNFLMLPPVTQNIYIQLSMAADDDGFVSKALITAKLCGGGINDLDELVKQDFLIRFERNVFLIKQWHVNNNKIKADRYKKTMYTSFLNEVETDESGVYLFKDNTDWRQDGDIAEPENIQDVSNNEEYGDNVETLRNQDGDITEAQSSIEKNRLEERRKEKTTPALAGSLSPNLRNNRTTTTDPLIHRDDKSSAKEVRILPPMDDDVMYSSYIKPSENDFNKTIMMIWSSGYSTNEEQNKQIKDIIASHKKQEVK